MWKEHGDSLKHHLIGFYRQFEHQKENEPNISLNKFAASYIKNEVDMEKGMDEYFQWLQLVDKRNSRVLRAIKTIKGKTYYKHLISYLKDASVPEWCEFEIVREPIGDEQKVTEYGRSITREWVEQWSVGTEGDSFEGYICLELNPGRYLKFRFSC
jgi:hypothetical protein